MLSQAVMGAMVVTLGNVLPRVVSLQAADNARSAKASATEERRPGASAPVDGST